MPRKLGTLVGFVLLLAACDASQLPFGLSNSNPRKAASPVDSTSRAALRGIITTPEGLPAVGVRVRAYSLSQAAAFRAQTMGVAAVETEVVTDASGSFRFTDPPEGNLNIEAVKSDDLKVFKSDVVVSKDKPADLGNLALQPTGTITGRVTAPSAPNVTNFEGVEVFIPGSSYTAKTNAAGNYTISNIAPGLFQLAASKVGLGRGTVANVEVKPKLTTTAADLALALVVPTITTVTPNNGGPGREVTIVGDSFGASSGETLLVLFAGAVAVGPNRIDDHTIRVMVPIGARTGHVLATVGGITSNGSLFTVLKSLSLDRPDSDLLLGRSLLYTVSAVDTDGQPVPNPSVQWAIKDGTSVTPGDGKVTALSNGDSTIEVSSGTLFLSRRIHVFEVTGVTLDKTVLTLNAMPENGSPDPGYTTSYTLVATVAASDGNVRKVAWSSSAPSLVTVDSFGKVQTTRGATEGTAVIKAASVDDPRFFATASVTVTVDGDLDLEVK